MKLTRRGRCEAGTILIISLVTINTQPSTRHAALQFNTKLYSTTPTSVDPAEVVINTILYIILHDKDPSVLNHVYNGKDFTLPSDFPSWVLRWNCSLSGVMHPDSAAGCSLVARKRWISRFYEKW